MVFHDHVSHHSAFRIHNSGRLICGYFWQRSLGFEVVSEKSWEAYGAVFSSVIQSTQLFESMVYFFGAGNLFLFTAATIGCLLAPCDDSISLYLVFSHEPA